MHYAKYQVEYILKSETKRKRQEAELEDAEMKVLKWMDRIRNQYVRGKLVVLEVKPD